MPRSYIRAMVIEQVRSGRRVAEVAATLDLPESTVFRWVRQDKVGWSHSGVDALGFRLERQQPPASWVTNNHLGVHTDKELTPSTVYAYRVCAVYANGFEASTTWLPVTTMPREQIIPQAPQPPPALTLQEVTQTGITIKWSGLKYDRVHIMWAKVGDMNWAPDRT